MSSRDEILRSHYRQLLRKIVAWTGLVAILGTMVVATPAMAATQESSRKAILSDDSSDATSVTYDVNWVDNGAGSIKAVRFQFCSNSPLYNQTCTAPGGTFVEPTAIGVQTDNGTTFTNTYTYGTNAGDVLVTSVTGNTFVSSHAYRFTLTGATNTTVAANNYQELYVRIITCNTTTCNMGGGDNVSYGGFAYDVVPKLSVTGTVQEDLTFCVAVTVTTPCSSLTGGSSVALSPNPMTTGGNSHGTAQMAASTNGSAGYAITYNGTGFTDTTADTIAAAPSGGAATNAGGTEQFGFTLGNQTSGNLNGVGIANSGGSGCTSTAPYNAATSTISYSTAGGVAVASCTGPTAATTYTMLFAANIANTTKPGVYTATQVFIATATF